MFYENQSQEEQNNYKKMLSVIGNLTLLFSASNCPYLPYRAHENIFCKYFHAENLARMDCSADAKKGNIGIGLKTWMGQDDQKVAEFGRLRETFVDLSGIQLIQKIADYRNERIRVTKNLNGIDTMIYHIVKRIPGAMQILECAFDPIDTEHLTLLPARGNVNNTYFTDGKHTYHFSSSKNTLYMLFEDIDLLDTFDVEIMDDPYTFLMTNINPEIPELPQRLETEPIETEPIETAILSYPQICLRLYSVGAGGRKFVAEKSGLNQWNAAGRPRNPNEIYIPYPAEDRERTRGFFPNRETVFQLHLPDGQVIPAKICQADGKAIMSNPNRILGEWLLRNVFELPEGTIVTYEMLQRFGVDSVVFTKLANLEYSIDFSDLGTYERFYEEYLED